MKQLTSERHSLIPPFLESFPQVTAFMKAPGTLQVVPPVHCTEVTQLMGPQNVTLVTSVFTRGNRSLCSFSDWQKVLRPVSGGAGYSDPAV